MKKIIFFIFLVLFISSCKINVWDEWVDIDAWELGKVKVGDNWVNVEAQWLWKVTVWDDWVNVEANWIGKVKVWNEGVAISDATGENEINIKDRKIKNKEIIWDWEVVNN